MTIASDKWSDILAATVKANQVKFARRLLRKAHVSRQEFLDHKAGWCYYISRKFYDKKGRK